MQSRAEIDDDLDRAADHIKVTQSLNDKLKSSKDIILVFTRHKKVGEQILDIAKWTLKQACRSSQNKNNPQKLVERQSKINFYTITLHIVENFYYQVIALDAYRSEDTNQVNKLKADLTLALSIIQKATYDHGRQIKAFGAVNWVEDDQEEVQKSAKKTEDFLINKEIGFISVKTQRKLYKAYHLQDGNLESLEIDEYKKISFDSFIKKNLNVPEVRREFEIWRRSIQNFLIAIVTPFKKILANIAKQIEIDGVTLCSHLIQKVRQVLPEGNQQLERVQPNKNDKSIAYEWFALQCLKIKENHMKEFKQNRNSIELLRSFYQSLFHQANFLPIVQSSNLVYVRKFAFFLIDQLNRLQEVSMQFLSPQVTAIFAELTVKDDFDRDVDNEAIKYKIAERLVNLQVVQDKRTSYYSLFENLTKQAFGGLKLENTVNKSKLQSGQKKILEALPLFRIQAIIKNECTSSEEINQEIKYIRQFLLEFVNKPAGTRNDWNKTLNIFARSGEKLKNYGFPELALEIFKKIRFQFMVQQSAKDLILKKGWTKKPQMSELYTDLSAYFQKIGNLEKSIRYSELAYENNPSDLENLKRLIEKKRKLMKNQVNKDEATLITRFSDNNLDAYFNYEFPPQFRAELENKDFDLVDTETSFEVDRSEALANILNFYAEL